MVKLECLGCGVTFDPEASKPVTVVPGLTEKQIEAISRVSHQHRVQSHVVDMTTLRQERKKESGADA